MDYYKQWKSEAEATDFVLGVRQRRRSCQTDKLRESVIIAELFAVKVILGLLDLTVHS